MAIIQSKERDGVRYLKRKNLEHEAKIVGNYYKDIIQQYGVDCNYYKLKIPYAEYFLPILDHNNVILAAYGMDSHPDYHISSDMVTFCEVENDIFQLNKYGITPNTDVNFYFDINQFACSLAHSLGQLKEYRIHETDVDVEIPENTSAYVEYDTNGNGCIETYTKLSAEYFDDMGYGISTWYQLSSISMQTGQLVGEVSCVSEEEFEKVRDTFTSERFYLSDDIFPYLIGCGYSERFYSDILSGRLSASIGPYTLSSDGSGGFISPEYTVMCDCVEHGDAKVDFPVNPYIYKSFEYEIRNKTFLDTMIYLTYTVRKIRTGTDVSGNPKYKCVLHGKLHGGVLFRDIFAIGKYIEKIHPEVGDIVTIDFPDNKSRQQYEITDCFDTNLGNDGINPLLHKYVWKCKARRRIDCGEDFPEGNEANDQIQEKQDLILDHQEEIAKKISVYDDETSDGVYGGYEKDPSNYDTKKVINNKVTDYTFIDDGSYLKLHKFGDGNMIVTDGYELFFVVNGSSMIKLTLVEEVETIKVNYVATGIDYIKATDNSLYFVNFDNRPCKICEDEDFTRGEYELCLNSLVDTTLKIKDQNVDGDYFYKFNGSETMLMSLNNNLYCRFGNKNHKLIKLS